MTRPVWPQRRPPTAMRSPPSAASRVQVLRELVRFEVTCASSGSGAPSARPEAGPEPAAGSAADSSSGETPEGATEAESGFRVEIESDPSAGGRRLTDVREGGPVDLGAVESAR